jgi:putative redox protein
MRCQAGRVIFQTWPDVFCDSLLGEKAMIVCQDEKAAYRTQVSNGEFQTVADATVDHGGGGAGFRPHEFLEAALATCLNMTVRIFADRHGLALTGVQTTVSLDRTVAGQTVFEYDIKVSGDLTAEETQRILQAAKACPVHKTLSGAISFRSRQMSFGSEAFFDGPS